MGHRFVQGVSLSVTGESRVGFRIPDPELCLGMAWHGISALRRSRVLYTSPWNVLPFNRLTECCLPAFAGRPSSTRIGRAVCRAGCLPTRNCSRPGKWPAGCAPLPGQRIVDLACGHVACWPNSSSCWTTSLRHWRWIFIPRRRSPGASLLETWPRLQGRVHFHQTDLRKVPLESRHWWSPRPACGGLTDLVLDRAAEVGAFGGNWKSSTN